MKIDEIRGGILETVSVVIDDSPFDPPLQKTQEVTLFFSNDQVMLADGINTCVIKGVDGPAHTKLTDYVFSGLPLLTYIANVRFEILTLSIRRLPQIRSIFDAMEIGLDDKVIDEIRRSFGVGGTAEDVASWLLDKLFLSHAPIDSKNMRRALVTMDTGITINALRIHGNGIAADIKRVDNKLRIERIVRGARLNESRQILLNAPMTIVDATAAAELHGIVRNTLSNLVAESNSYLRIWQFYQEKDLAIVNRRANQLGSIRYTSRKQLRDGDWSFHLEESDHLDDQLSLLRQWDNVELEACKQATKTTADSNTFQLGRNRIKTNDRHFTSTLSNLDEFKRRIDLKPTEEDHDQTKPPESGYLILATSGDMARLERRARAEEALRTGNCQLPQLGLLFEGQPTPGNRRISVNVRGPKLKKVIAEVFGESKPTENQLKAINCALNTPEICLIQGPPGTGKTRVITAIEKCLAVLADEGVEPSHRILVSAAQHDAVENVAQRTEVFGLPAVKVGKRRRASDTTIDYVKQFAEERIDVLRSKVQKRTESEILTEARNLIFACMRTPSLPVERTATIRKLADLLSEVLPPTLRDKLLKHAQELSRPAIAYNPEDSELLLKAVRSIRVDAIAFADDGPLKASIALKRLDSILLPAERDFLERSAKWTETETPGWLNEGKHLRDALVDRLTPAPTEAEPVIDENTNRLFLEVLDTLVERLAHSRESADYAIAEYMRDLENDPDAVRRSLEHYTVVLASTLQQSAGTAMRNIRGISTGTAAFESIIVDEAARAHPLDLFIPLSMAQRRAILVGDHRQLPHLLEPDVESEIAGDIKDGEVHSEMLEAIKISLFERLWNQLPKLEDLDRYHRRITLNAQYRMHPALGEFISRVFYEFYNDGHIDSPRPVEHFKHNLPNCMNGEVPCAAIWLDVPGVRGREVKGVSKSRPSEARVIAEEVQRLIKHDSTLTFGVIAFYSAQVDIIGKEMMRVGLTESTESAQGWKVADQWATTYNQAGKKVERLRIGTVDAFQGKEFDVVFLSITRSNNLPSKTTSDQRRKFGHLMLENRLCVAMSRQQRLLVAVGDRAFVEAEDVKTPLRALRAFIDLCGGPYGLIR